MKHANLAGDLAGYLAGDIVAKNCAIVAKTDLTRDIVGDLTGANKIVLSY
jgi:hypothetical protein